MVVIFCTVPTNVSKDLALKIINSRLAACINIVKNVTSVYHWKGEVVEDSEDLLVIKTHEDLLEDIKSFIKANHPYTVPEIVSLDVRDVNKEYLDWLVEETINKRG